MKIYPPKGVAYDEISWLLVAVAAVTTKIGKESVLYLSILYLSGPHESSSVESNEAAS